MNSSNIYCGQCGQATQLQVPAGDHLERQVCGSCGEIHYRNPKLIAGAIAEYDGKILLCKRNIEPRKGFWTLPAGYMEMSETSEQAAARETWEEAEARLCNMQFYRLYDIPRISQVYVFYRALMVSPDCRPTPESLEVGLFDEADIPWGSLAFKVVAQVLKDYFADRQRRLFEPKRDLIKFPTARE